MPRPTKPTIAYPVATLDQALAITSNGHPKRLIALLDYYERAAHAIRTTLELLDADAQKSSHRRIAGTIRTAQGIDAMRHAAKRTVTGRQTKSKISAQRQRSADVLATLDRTEPRALAPDAVRLAGVLARRGYLRRVAKGLFVRTGKEYRV